MAQLMEHRVLQIKGGLLVDETWSQSEIESLSPCHPRHLWSGWLLLLLWNARKYLVCLFFSSPPYLFNKGLAENGKDKERLHFRDGVESPGFLSHVSMTDGKCFRGKSTQVAAKNSMCKCTWQVQEKKNTSASCLRPVLFHTSLSTWHVFLFWQCLVASSGLAIQSAEGTPEPQV